MSIRVVTGGAGTGKTTRLLALVDEWLTKNELREGQQVLALTFMHGSRRRLTDKLGASKARGRFECTTFDGFARELCSRWRSRVAAIGIAIPDDDAPEVYEAICTAAAALLAVPDIAKWVAATHPLVIVDEFQDCHGDRPQVVERLAVVADVLVAADPFQDLNALEANPALKVLNRATSNTETLTQVYRTRVPAILSAASSLRCGQPLRTGAGLSIASARSRDLAAYEVCKSIASVRAKRLACVIISALRPKGKRFPGEVLDKVATTKGYGPNKSLGPYDVRWESSPEAFRDELLALFGGDSPMDAAAILATARPENPLRQLLADWLERERRLRGRNVFECAEIRTACRRAEMALRARPRLERGLRAMTIHQAKNREFPAVVVLWPMGVPGGPELQRRWLYNAITRAQHAVAIVVEDPKGDRLKGPPFA